VLRLNGASRRIAARRASELLAYLEIAHRARGVPACVLAASLAGLLPASTGHATELRIGVLSVLDEEASRRDWRPLAEGLAQRLAPHAVRLQAFDLAGLEEAVAGQEVSFVVTNPGHYVQLEARHRVTRIATQTAGVGHDPAHAVGSAVVVRSGPQGPAGLADLAGRRVAAVSEQAFGGYQLVAAEWTRRGVDVEGGAVALRFTGFPMTRVVDAVLAGEADAGILRTCLLERLEGEGRVPAGALTVVGARHDPALPCRSSTALYPGWAFAALPSVPPTVSREVLLALLALPPDGADTHWSVPADYQRVHDVLRTLQVQPYAFLREHRLEALARRYWFVLAGLALWAVLGGAYALRVDVLVKRRTAELRRALAERDRLARDRERDRETMDHLSRLSILGELAARLGHEISHPLATIGNYAASLQRRVRSDTLTTPALQQGLAEIAHEADRAAQVLQGVRDLARKRPGERRACDPALLVHEAVALFRGIQVHAHDVRVVAEADLPAVQADPLQLQQVLLNLLKNAQDVMRCPEATAEPIELRVAREGDDILIGVTDRGPALTEEARARLFEPFHTTKPGGLGLGLPICRSIVEAHGGSLRARPASLAGGMVFEVRLPVAAGGIGVDEGSAAHAQR